MNISAKLNTTEASIFSVMSNLANQHDAINLSQGFPDFKCDQNLIDAVSFAMNAGHNQYAPMPGLMDLRVAIAKKFDLLYGTSYHPESEITITSGATQAIYTIISTFVKQDDEVLIFKPAYDCYEPSIKINGGKPISMALKAPDYKVYWDEVKKSINLKTKMIIINTPHNPSGTLMSKSDMLKLQELTNGTDIIILSDEVYEHIVFDDEQHQSVCRFPELKKRSFITASFGKTFHVTGWKTGYCCAPKALMQAFRNVHQFNVFSVNHPMQKGIADYMKDPNRYLELPEFYQQKRDLFLELIKDSRFKFSPSKGTYYQLLDFTDITTENDLEFAKRLTTEKGIASIPLSPFNDNARDDKVLRFCFAKTEDTLKKAADILNRI
ncbi:aminotransferase class I/II-fold pyridoxal phosphate-dependent enzyme [Subsaximicrobium wynnwilliamsii]|uniref:Aminotransferase class I/II-fold pyridoxal phosphate-dependent enzyme n=1 Tax=Subsaximicrobium wynnwilliamsii TaxID=291179 RepID=A0A5C6ZLI7_9FLAO|nr:methionine aminotransferase [Subsaximicrobium wynnwilliamsii]TXD83781.1 aminotransferase class I/II-fold pyridoxal phosphate-dependent enzyme [Subsaximicrobium wynnwilliamsii]TXD89507.1 aminotransferase class I/II-fold pyridoxal phosphate-dependent enzyme [Subsaximicrobium wynnwilliamsii]TXE03617.1 aminotransferase class I/II-fold pyridoxal phosphate-dependent enzyme [Subsaximicrobium wynnwilliamsii]